MDEGNDSATAPAPGTVQNLDEEGPEMYQGVSDYESDHKAPFKMWKKYNFFIF